MCVVCCLCVLCVCASVVSLIMQSTFKYLHDHTSSQMHTHNKKQNSHTHSHRVVRAELGPKLSSPSAAQTPNKAAAAGTSTATPLQSAAQAVLTAAAGTSTATPASQVLVSLNSDTPPPPSLDVKAEADTAGNATPAGVPKTDKIVGVRYPAALLSEVRGVRSLCFVSCAV